MRVLLIAHTCKPVGASEPGSAWNWALHLAECHEVTLVCHPQYSAETDPALRAAGGPFRIEYVELPRWADPWKPEQSERGLRLHYLLWQRAALRRARHLHSRNTFDIVHQVGLGSVSAPSPFWRLGIPLVWGPLGGGQTPPSQFRNYFGHDWARETRRTWRLRALPYVWSLRRTVARAALVMATNHETLALLRRAGARDPLLFPDSGVDPRTLSQPRPARPINNETVLIWAGRLEAHKGLPVGLEALAKVTSPVRLLVAGEGPLRTEWEQLAHRLGLQHRVEFLGMLPSGELRRRFQEADGFLFTSLRDSTGSVIWQALAEALPIITLDHHGVGALVPSDAALKVPVETPEITLAELTAAIETFARMGSKRGAMADAALRVASGNSWPKRAAAVTRHYEQILSSRRPVASESPAVAVTSGGRSKAGR
jgi:glycosyltransferase involved in cell wall biosynthesis